MTVILPKFTQIFTDMKVPLPASTEALITVSRLSATYWWLLLWWVLLGPSLPAIQFQPSGHVR